jgi:hypothetical protein
MNHPSHQAITLEVAQGQGQHALGNTRYLLVQFGEAQGALVSRRP